MFICINLYIKLACEPSAAQVTYIVTTAVYPQLDDFTGKLTFRYKIRPTQLKSQNQAIEHSRGSPEDPNQNLRQTGS